MTITSIPDIVTRVAEGRIAVSIGVSGTASGATNPTAGSGLLGFSLSANVIGTTYPGTLQGFQEPPALSGDYMNLVSFMGSTTGSARPTALVRAYLAGTLNLTATGDQFTHNAATFPLLRTKYGQANQPVNLIPILQLTTATSVTAPAFQIQTNAGGAGYVNQDGTGVIGTNTFTFPAAATANGSCYFLPLNSADYSVQDITQIKVTTASTTGAANIWLIEELAYGTSMVAAPTQYDDFLDAGIGCSMYSPAVATSGTANSKLLIATYGNASTLNGIINIAVKL